MSNIESYTIYVRNFEQAREVSHKSRGVPPKGLVLFSKGVQINRPHNINSILWAKRVWNIRKHPKTRRNRLVHIVACREYYFPEINVQETNV